MTAEQIANENKRQGLQLSRQRLVQDLELATNPLHRQMIEAALHDIEARLTKL